MWKSKPAPTNCHLKPFFNIYRYKSWKISFSYSFQLFIFFLFQNTTTSTYNYPPPQQCHHDDMSPFQYRNTFQWLLNTTPPLLTHLRNNILWQKPPLEELNWGVLLFPERIWSTSQFSFSWHTSLLLLQTQTKQLPVGMTSFAVFVWWWLDEEGKTRRGQWPYSRSELGVEL